MRASRAAVGTHLEAKLRLLKAALVNAALPEAPADFLTMRFLGLVDELSPEHFLLLEYGRDPVAWFERRSLERPAMSGPRTEALKRAAVGLERAWEGLVIKDLGERVLIDAGMLSGMVTAPSMYDRFTTDLGDQLLDFVAMDLHSEGTAVAGSSDKQG